MTIFPPLGLYIHFPWCVRKCPYCDFNSHAVDGAIPEQAYIDALLADLELDLASVGSRRIETIFMGGGTPSLFSPGAIRRLIDGIAARVELAADAEITLEANPGTVEAGRFEGYRQAGVNRLSMGIQSFNDDHLRRLGRIHSGAEARAAAAMARGAGFDNFNLDLMFGLPEQTPEDARADVEQALTLQPTHVSFYQLTLEPNTLFHRYPPVLPGEDTTWQIQQTCQAVLKESGFVQYEVSAYAQEGRRCRHNLNYWQFGDYLGIGAGAHGKFMAAGGAVLRCWKHKQPQQFLKLAGTPECRGGAHRVSTEDLPVEFLMNHLRLRDGFALRTYTERTGLTPESLEPGLSRAVEHGLLDQTRGVIRCTDTGWNFLDNVLMQFLPAE